MTLYKFTVMYNNKVIDEFTDALSDSEELFDAECNATSNVRENIYVVGEIIETPTT